MPTIRILLVDDHTLFRAGIRSLLQTVKGVEVVGEASDGREAIHLCKLHTPHVILMDILMPGLNGLETTARLAQTSPAIRCIMMTMNADEDTVFQSLQAGAAGYLVKMADPSELELAIRAVVRGETYLSSAISHHITARLGRMEQEKSSFDRLMPRHREVLQLIAEGYTTKEIAKKLGVTPKTTESYRAELMKELDVHNIAGLTRYALRKGVITLNA